MNITKVLVPYGDEENRKKLESYIEEKTGRKIAIFLERVHRYSQ